MNDAEPAVIVSPVRAAFNRMLAEEPDPIPNT